MTIKQQMKKNNELYDYLKAYMDRNNMKTLKINCTMSITGKTLNMTESHNYN